MHWMLLPYRRYADFAGRSLRVEYWSFVLSNILFWVAWYLVAVAGGGGDLWVNPSTSWLLYPFLGIAGLYQLVSIIPGFAVTIRRLHDTDRSGWNVLWSAVPIVGAFIVLYFVVSKGTDGINRFGPPPAGA